MLLLTVIGHLLQILPISCAFIAGLKNPVVSLLKWTFVRLTPQGLGERVNGEVH